MLWPSPAPTRVRSLSMRTVSSSAQIPAQRVRVAPALAVKIASRSPCVGLDPVGLSPVQGRTVDGGDVAAAGAAHRLLASTLSPAQHCLRLPFLSACPS